MSTIEEQIKDIEDELAKTPHHKATDHHIGRLRARIARLKDQQIETSLKKGSGGGGGYAVKKHGDATIVLVGPPSVGKSTLINKLTNAASKVAEYSFTTVSVIPGMLEYKGARFQILDIPGLIAGAKEGKGRGREVLSVVRNADLIVLMTDIYKMDILTILEKELFEAGLRINQTKPHVKIDKQIDGGLNIFTNIRQEFDKETVKEVAREVGIKNADITIKEKLTFDRLIDALNQNKIYTKALYVINKADRLTTTDQTSKSPNYLYLSAETGLGLDNLKEAIWLALEFSTVFLVEPNEDPNTDHPIIIKKGKTIKQLGEKIGRNFIESKKSAKIWGKGAKFTGQEVSLETPIQDGMQIRFV